ncbi:hypothetical protein AAG747_28590 [Rapidithrix thailandica]|uniref:Uncharacterized protein n=1 Tax=Rapidithrix thailandica TaxID=413964 RepID=A0AAW9SM50_9BACT
MVVEDKILAKKIASLEYQTANKALREVLAKVNAEEQLSIEDIKYILNIPEKSLIGDFLIEYDYFTEDQKSFIESYIIANLNDEDRDFVSDMIDFATIESLNLPYEVCIDFLKSNTEGESYVVSSVLSYLISQPKFNYIEKLFVALTNVLEDASFFQNAQLKAAFCLFRITQDRKYLREVIELVEKGQSINKDLLKNMLSIHFNNNKYFSIRELEKYR